MFGTIQIKSESRLWSEITQPVRGWLVNFDEIKAFWYYVVLWIWILKCAEWRFNPGQKLNQEFTHEFGLQFKHVVVKITL